MPYQLLENVAIADACYEIWGATLDELFRDGFTALMQTMAELTTVHLLETETFELENTDIERLFFDFLEELVYRKDVNSRIYKSCQLSITQDTSSQVYKLHAVISGQNIDDTVSTIADVKAVTYYRFFVKFIGNKWKSQVTFDL